MFAAFDGKSIGNVFLQEWRSIIPVKYGKPSPMESGKPFSVESGKPIPVECGTTDSGGMQYNRFRWNAVEPIPVHCGKPIPMERVTRKGEYSLTAQPDS